MPGDPYRDDTKQLTRRVAELRAEHALLNARITDDERVLKKGYRAARVAEKLSRTWLGRSKNQRNEVTLLAVPFVFFFLICVGTLAYGWIAPLIAFCGLAILGAFLMLAANAEAKRPFDPNDYEESTVPAHLRAMRKQLDVDRESAVRLLEEIDETNRSLAAMQLEDQRARSTKTEGS